MMQEEKTFFVYADRTLEEVPRVFYVGKGKKNRLTCAKRNKRWDNIANKYGSSREVFLATKNEEYAFEIERELIKKYKTFAEMWPDGDGWGANFTEGGDGVSGLKHSNETKKRLSVASSGKNNPMYGKRGELAPNFGKHSSEETKRKLRDFKTGKIHTEESKIKMSASSTGKIHTEETKRKIRQFNLGKIMSEESKIKIGNAHRGKIILQESIDKANKTKKENPFSFTDEMKKKMSIARTGEKNNSAILNENNVIEIREKYLSGKYKKIELAMEYGVSRSCIGLIVTNKSWKHLLNKKGNEIICLE